MIAIFPKNQLVQLRKNEMAMTAPALGSKSNKSEEKKNFMPITFLLRILPPTSHPYSYLTYVVVCSGYYIIFQMLGMYTYLYIRATSAEVESSQRLFAKMGKRQVIRGIIKRELPHPDKEASRGVVSCDIA
jgi:hypothetical protein